MFEEVSCEVFYKVNKSYLKETLFIFSKENALRRGCYYIVKHKLFDNFILFVIIISSIKLAIDTYLDLDDSLTKKISEYIDLAFTIIFAIESFLKIIAFGLFWDVGSYLRDTWS